MAATRKTTQITKIFSTAGYRKDAPINLQITGYQRDNDFVATIANNYMKVGWWVAYADTAPITVEPPPKPPPTDDIRRVQIGIFVDPDETSRLEGFLKQGEEVTVFEIRDAWALVETPAGVSGWCLTNALVPVGETPPPSATITIDGAPGNVILSVNVNDQPTLFENENEVIWKIKP